MRFRGAPLRNLRYGEQFAAHAADDACVADADHGAAVGVGEGGEVDLNGARLLRRAAVCAGGRWGLTGISAGRRLEVGEEERVGREFGEGLRRE